MVRALRGSLTIKGEGTTYTIAEGSAGTLGDDQQADTTTKKKKKKKGAAIPPDSQAPPPVVNAPPAPSPGGLTPMTWILIGAGAAGGAWGIASVLGGGTASPSKTH
jgi:hypothetical protein